jgi:hypothetical protein
MSLAATQTNRFWEVCSGSLGTFADFLPREPSSAPERHRERHFQTGPPNRGALSYLMRTPGVEPGRVSPQDPKSCASASSATFA